MLKRIALLAMLVLTACGVPAAPEPPRTATLVLPTRVPVEATAAADVANNTQATQPPAVAQQPSATPTRVRPTLTPTMTLIPPTGTPAPPTETPPPPPTEAADVEAGRVLFASAFPDRPEVPACTTCHNLQPNSAELKLGPDMNGVAIRAASRVPGQNARTYLYNSIVHPNDYVVPNEGNKVYGVTGQSLMYQNYEHDLTPEQINNLVGYLLTLR